jgi:glycosyltransferase involved in cell wall biosynthesis
VKASHKRKGLRLILLGSGSQASVLRSIFLEGGVSENVDFRGPVPQADLPRYYQMADLYVSASHVDGSSVSLMEALASGKPSIVTDLPGNREWVQPGVQGWLFPDGDVESLAEAIVMAFDRRGELKGMGRAARDLAEQKANWEINFPKLLQAYDLALQRMI